MSPTEYFIATIASLEKTLADTQGKLGIAVSQLRKINERLPKDGDNRYACNFCDMGEAGYSKKGAGTHDDKCVYREIEEALKRIEQHNKGSEG